jgi:hypothetical protein
MAGKHALDPEHTFWSLWVQPLVPVMFEALMAGRSENRIRQAALATFNIGVDLVDESQRLALTDPRHRAVWNLIDPPPPEDESDADLGGDGRLPK